MATTTPRPLAISVSVTGNGTTTPYAIVVSPDRAGAGPIGNAAAITWSLATGGWTFASNGIAFDNGGSGQISNSRSTGGPQGPDTGWVASDANTVAGELKYTVNLSGSSGPLSKDPTIINGSA